MSRIPTLVKIDEFQGRTHGDDMDIVSHFVSSLEREVEEIEKLDDELDDMGYDY